MPRVSVIIATCNRAASLPAAIEGLRRQHYPSFEVIVVPGPCKDDTLQGLARYPWLRVVPCPEASVGRARNIGVAAAAGEVIVFLDDDAVPRGADWLALHAGAYVAPEVAAVGGHVWDAVADQMQWRLCVCSRDGLPDTDAAGPAERYQGRGADPFIYLAGCNMSLRRSAIQQVGGFNEALPANYDDVDICRRLIDAGLRIRVLPEALVDHAYAPNANRDGQGMIVDPYRLIVSYAVFVGHNPVPGAAPDAAETLTRRWAGSWRENARWRAETGQLAEAALPRFLERIEAGEREGLRLGAQPRLHRAFPAADPAAFRPIRHAA
ncbi:glycosyltransferase family 2 protein [Humitalea rosea]|nr:glycosyltransferase family 2 protein [Humitalea rosea]